MKGNRNARLAYLTRRAIADGRSIIGKNLRLMMDIYDVTSYEIELDKYLYQITRYANDDDKWLVEMIKELRCVRKGQLEMRNFDSEEVCQMIEMLSSM